MGYKGQVQLVKGSAIILMLCFFATVSLPALAAESIKAESTLEAYQWTDDDLTKVAYADKHTKKHMLRVRINMPFDEGSHLVDVYKNDNIIKMSGFILNAGDKITFYMDITKQMFSEQYLDGDELTIVFSKDRGHAQLTELARTTVNGIGLLTTPTFALPYLSTSDGRAQNIIVRHYRPAMGRSTLDVGELYARSRDFGFYRPVADYTAIGEKDGNVFALSEKDGVKSTMLSSDFLQSLQHGDVVSAYTTTSEGRFSKATSKMIDKTPRNVQQKGDNICAELLYGSEGDVILVDESGTPLQDGGGNLLTGTIGILENGTAAVTVLLPADQRAVLNGKTVRLQLKERSDNSVTSAPFVLKTVAEKDDLVKALNIAQRVKESDRFTYANADAKDAFIATLKKAEILLQDPNAGQTEVDIIVQKLKETAAVLNGEKPIVPAISETNARSEKNHNVTSRDYSKQNQNTINTEEKIEHDAQADNEIDNQADRQVAPTPQLIAASAPYLHGYSDGSFAPESAMTRAETAAILSRLLLVEKHRDTKTVPFRDVMEDDWYAGAVVKLCDEKILSGYEDNTFRPQKPISRAEFAALLSRLANKTEPTNAPTFHDVPQDHWAKDAIAFVADTGWMRGTTAAQFTPDRPLTRAETTVILNRLTGRNHAALKTTAPRQFSDVPATHWAANDILIAANVVAFDEDNIK